MSKHYLEVISDSIYDHANHIGNTLESFGKSLTRDTKSIYRLRTKRRYKTKNNKNPMYHKNKANKTRKAHNIVDNSNTWDKVSFFEYISGWIFIVAIIGSILIVSPAPVIIAGICIYIISGMIKGVE